MEGEDAKCMVRSTPTAHKAHRCCECGGTIQVGEKYRRFSGVWADGPAIYKVCEDCEYLRSDVDADARPDEITPFGCLAENIGDSGVPEWRERFNAIQKRRTEGPHR